MTEILEIIQKIWEVDILNIFKVGKINTERQLQAEIYFHLKNSLGKDYEIWVEPVIYLKSFDLDKVKPDLIISRKKDIIGIIELKLVTWGYAQYQGDLRKLKNFFNAAQKSLQIALGWEPKTNYWSDLQKQQELRFNLNKEMGTAFMVITKPDAGALDKNEVLKFSPPRNFFHFGGWIDNNSKIVFQRI